MDKHSLKRLFVIGVVTSLVASALTGIFVLLKGSFDDTDWKILGTTLTVGVFSITSLANLRNLDSEFSSYRSFAIASITISVAAFFLAAFLIWGSGSWDDLWKFAITLSVLAVSSAHSSLLLPLRQKNNSQKILVTGTLTFIGAVAGMIIYLIWVRDTDVGDFYYRLLGVFAILDVLGTIVSPILAKFSPTPAAPQQASLSPAVPIVSPASPQPPDTTNQTPPQ